MWEAKKGKEGGDERKQMMTSDSVEYTVLSTMVTIKLKNLNILSLTRAQTSETVFSGYCK